MATALIAKPAAQNGFAGRVRRLRPGFFSRVGHAMLEAQQRKADGEIAEILAWAGGVPQKASAVEPPQRVGESFP